MKTKKLLIISSIVFVIIIAGIFDLMLKDNKESKEKKQILGISLIVGVIVVVFCICLLSTSEKNRDESNKESSKGENNIDDFVPGMVEVKVTELLEDSVKGIVVNGGLAFQTDKEVVVKGINSTSEDENGKKIEKGMIIVFSCTQKDITDENTVVVDKFSIKDN